MEKSRNTNKKRPRKIAPARRAGLRSDERDPDERKRKTGSAGGGKNMSGTPSGGLAAGGMAGTNSPTGAIDDEIDELDDAYGEGTADISGREEVLSHPPYAGRSGGAVGGTPAEKRAIGGNIGSARGDITNLSTGRESTIGGSTTRIERKKSPEKPRRSKGVRRKNSH